MTAYPSERTLRGLARLALFGVVSAVTSSCREDGYDVGVNASSDGTGGRSGGAGKSSTAGTTNTSAAGRGGTTSNPSAGHSTTVSGGVAGMAPTSNAGRDGANGGKSSEGGGLGVGGDGVGGTDTALGGMPQAVGGSDASGGTSGGAHALGGADTNGGTSGASAGTSNTSGGTVTSTGGGVAGKAGGTSTAGSGPCGLLPNPTLDRTKRRMLLRDEGVGKIALIDVGNAANGWVTPLPREQVSTQIPTPVQGRDMQLVGNCRVMVGTDIGYEEYAIQTGQKAGEVTGFSATLAAHRLRNGNTMLVGVGTVAVPFQDSVGIVLVEVTAAATVVTKYVYPGTYARLARQTSTGSFLITNNTRVIEGYTTKLLPTDTMNQTSTVTFDASKVTNCTSGYHFWQALRVPTATAGVSEVAVATGYCASLAFFREDGSFRARITGGTASIAGGATAVNPRFFSGFQRLSNGNYLVANWSAHGPGHFTEVIPILEYTPAGALAWFWGDPAYKDVLSGIQGVIVLDGLDPTKLHVEDSNGQLVPVN